MQRRRRQVSHIGLKEKAIGVAVSACRNEAGISQEELAAQCDFDRTYISRVERGILNPTAIRLWKIADALAIPFHQIVNRMEDWVQKSVKKT